MSLGYRNDDHIFWGCMLSESLNHYECQNIQK